MSEYWLDPRFDSKKPSADALHPDNIYEPNGLRLEQVKNPSHGQDTAERDKRGVYSLVMSPAWHFTPGQLEMTEDSGLRMDPFNRRGHRVSDIDEAAKAALVAWLSRAPLNDKKFNSSVSG